MSKPLVQYPPGQECRHLDLKKTTETTDDGAPIYYCAGECGAGLFVVKPYEITVHFGTPPACEPV